MTDKPRGRIRSALLEVLTPPATTDSETLGRDSDPWSSPAGIAREGGTSGLDWDDVSILKV